MNIRFQNSIRLRHSSGVLAAAFSLIEVMFAMLVVGISSIALFSGINSGFFTMRLARENLLATQMMLEKTEMLRLYNWDQLTNASFIPLTAFVETNSGISYTCQVQLASTTLNTIYSNSMKRVTITLNWATGGLARNRTFTTYVSRNGLQNYVY